MRSYEHKEKIIKGFTAKYDVNQLVYAEPTEDVEAAIKREKMLKAWKRKWKIDLIQGANPGWEDLYYQLN